MTKSKFFSSVPYILSILLILVQILRWDLMEYTTIFLWIPIEYGIYGLFIIWFLIILIRMLIKLKSGQKSLIKPSVFMLVTFLIAFYVDFTGLWLNYNFKSKLADRMEVIKLIRNKTLVPNVTHDSQQINLPEKMRHVSIGGGDILFNQDFVFFFTFRGILDHAAGFIYSEEGLEPSQSLMEYNAIYKINGNWNWIGYCSPSKNAQVGPIRHLASGMSCD